MTPLAGPVHAAAVVVLAAGAAKASQPGATGAALRAVRLPGTRLAVRVLATVELAVAVAVLAGGGAPAAAALAALHVGFAAVAVALRRAAATCGCFGNDTPVTVTHVVVNLAVAALAVAATVETVPSIYDASDATPAAGIPYAILVVLLAVGEVLCLTALAEVQTAAAAVRRGARNPR